MTSKLRRLHAQIAVHESWARTADRTARTAPAREARNRRYIERARELHPGAPHKVVAQAAESLRLADLKRMSYLAAKARQDAHREAA